MFGFKVQCFSLIAFFKIIGRCMLNIQSLEMQTTLSISSSESWKQIYREFYNRIFYFEANRKHVPIFIQKLPHLNHRLMMWEIMVAYQLLQVVSVQSALLLHVESCKQLVQCDGNVLRIVEHRQKYLKSIQTECVVGIN